jgi:predicted peptidase
MWAGRHWSEANHALAEKPSRQMRLLTELLESLEKEYPIDRDRLYVMGLSMGGFGTWDIIERYPQRFAAAAPICGGSDETLAARIAGVPIWVFHGDTDTAVPVARSREMVKALKAAGGKPRYSEYPGVGHNSWTPAFNEPELLKWMYGQRRGANNREDVKKP